MLDWRYVAASTALFSTLVVVGGGAAVAHADAAGGTSNVTESGSHTSSSIADRSDDTSTRTTETTAGEGGDAESSRGPRPAGDADATGSSAAEVPSVSDSTGDSSPSLPDDAPPSDNPPVTEVGSSTDPSTVPADDTPATEPTPSAQGTGSGSSAPAAESSSGSIPVVIETATSTDDSAVEVTASPVGTGTSSTAEPAAVPTPAVTASSVVESVAASVAQPTPPTVEPSAVAPVVVTAVPTVVPLVSVTVVAPPSVLQWFVLLTWFQLQWLVQQSLSGPGATAGLNRLDARNPMSTVFQNPQTSAFLAMQLPWLRTTLDALQAMPMAALQGMRLVDLTIDPAMRQRISMTLAAETASAPAIAKAFTDQVRSRLAGHLSAPCIGTFVRNVSLWALFTAAALGLLGLTGLTGIGTMVGFRQAKAGFALQASGLARFTGPGPLGVVRQGGFVRVGSRRASAEAPRLRVVGTDVRDSA